MYSVQKGAIGSAAGRGSGDGGGEISSFRFKKSLEMSPMLAELRYSSSVTVMTALATGITTTARNGAEVTRHIGNVFNVLRNTSFTYILLMLTEVMIMNKHQQIAANFIQCDFHPLCAIVES